MASRLAGGFVNQLHFTCHQSLKVLIHAAMPYKNIAYYRRYFATVEQVTVQQDNRTIGLYKLGASLMIYIAFLNLIHFFAPLKYYTRVLLYDFVTIIQMDAQINLIFSGLTFYAIFLNHAMYFSMNPTMFAFAKKAFTECPGFIESRKSTQSSAKSPITGCTKLTILGNQNVLFGKLALMIINSLQIFVLIAETGCLFCFLLSIAVFIQQCVPDFRNLTLGSFLLHLLLLLPFHICHIFLCMIS